ncbi:MAG: hypothetical protein HQL54_14110 [Magnetococcales bacterium]|nr:hypothetical protein [Magnetococcales bacterium]
MKSRVDAQNDEHTRFNKQPQKIEIRDLPVRARKLSANEEKEVFGGFGSPLTGGFFFNVSD